MAFPDDPADDLAHAAQQVVVSATDADYLDQLIPAIKKASASNGVPRLLQNLAQISDQRESEIERMCNTNHQEFITSVDQLLRVREGTGQLTSDILKLNESIQTSTEWLLEQKKALVESRNVRQNIDEATQALNSCLEVLRLANYVHELLAKKNHYGALRTLDELQNVYLRQITRYKLADLIRASVPATQKLISDAVMTDLNTWLYRIRETAQFLGEVAFYHTELRRNRQKERAEKMLHLGNVKLNSAIELVSDEMEEFDVLDNEEVQVDFSPLFECLHIHEALGRSDKFRAEYAATRRQQKELLLPPSINLTDEDDTSLSGLLEGIAGFAIVEKVTMKKVQNLRSPVDGWGYSVQALDAFLLTLFKEYAELLKKRFGDDFQEIVSTDDYMPMPVNNLEQYDKVVNVSWYVPEKEREEIMYVHRLAPFDRELTDVITSFPFVFPFSQMYPLSCINIRNFLNQFYFFSDDHFQHPSVLDETLKEKSLDELLADNVCHSLVERLNSQYLGQIVQILINLEHFETACRELEQLLADARSSPLTGGPVVLRATEAFRGHKKTAEKRIFELVNSKIDDLIETAEYDWMATTLESEPSNYMQTLTRYLSNIMNSTLLGLPREIKELIYFDALSHTAARILVSILDAHPSTFDYGQLISIRIKALPLSSDVRSINPNGVAALAKDVDYLSEFVDSLDVPILKENLDELQQTTQLMRSSNSDEYYDVATRNKKYGRVDPMNGPALLEKLTHTVQQPSTMNEKLSALSSRLGMNL
ncbi:MAG: hypothetical protein M1815_002375 [Lichina confinis]|nr:MAG: hypothetical protein M1815_002375 [Lichina confinis]